MNLTCTSKMIKYLLIAFNFLFVITGVILIAIGVTVKTVYSEYQTFLDDKYFSLPNMLIATGCIVFFVSLCGFCGALKESWLIVAIFSVFLIIIFIFELSIGIAGYVLRNRTSDFLHAELIENMNKYNNSEVIIKKMWDLVQTEFECCGVDSYKDWGKVYTNDSLPISCCPHADGAVGVFYCTANFNDTISRSKRQAPNPHPEIKPAATIGVSVPNGTTIANNDANETTAKVPQLPGADISTTWKPPFSSSTPYQLGCTKQFGSFISLHASDLGAAGIVLAVLQLLGIVFSIHLAKQLKNGYYST